MLIKINVPILNTCTIDVSKESCAKLSHIHSDISIQLCFLLLSHIPIASAMSHDRLMQNDIWKKKRINPIWPFDIERKQMKTTCILSVRKFNSMIVLQSVLIALVIFLLRTNFVYQKQNKKILIFLFCFSSICLFWIIRMNSCSCVF